MKEKEDKVAVDAKSQVSDELERVSVSEGGNCCKGLISPHEIVQYWADKPPSAFIQRPYIEKRRGERRKSRPWAQEAAAEWVDLGRNIRAEESFGKTFPGLNESIQLYNQEAAILSRVFTGNGYEDFRRDDGVYMIDDSDPITVLVASDPKGKVNEIIKDRLPLLEKNSNIQIIGYVTDPSLLCESLKWQPKVLLLDKALFDHIDIDLISSIQSKTIGTNVILLWTGFLPSMVDNIMRIRVYGYLEIESPLEVFMKAIRVVSRGEVWLPRALLAKAFLDSVETLSHGDTIPKRDLSNANGLAALTKREEQIVSLVSEGLSNKSIASRLGIMEDTVKKHLQSIFDKLGIRRRTLLAMYYFERQQDIY